MGAHFADEWKWMGNYDAWRGAMLVFFFPENLLIPSLREDSERTPSFGQLLKDLRKLKLQYQSVALADQAKIQQEWAALIDKGNQTVASLEAAGVKALRSTSSSQSSGAGIPLTPLCVRVRIPPPP